MREKLEESMPNQMIYSVYCVYIDHQPPTGVLGTFRSNVHNALRLYFSYLNFMVRDTKA